MKIPDKIKPLEPYLIGEPTDDGEWQLICPLHHDQKRSASLNVKLGLWNCFAGCGGGSVKDLLAQREDWIPVDGTPAPSSGSPSGGGDGLPPVDYVYECTANLLDTRSVINLFRKARGLTKATIRKFNLGYDPEAEAITIPVFDAEENLLTVRYYNLDRTKNRKFWHVKGHGGPFLYPLNIVKDSDFLIVCEGELDAAILHQAGYPAITKTAGASTWRAAWNHVFKGKRVYLVHDMDAAGQAANLKIGRQLSTVAEVSIISLPFPVTEDHGQDITDFWLTYGGTANRDAKGRFDDLIDGAIPFSKDVADPKELPPEDSNPVDAVNAELYGRPLRMTLTIKGRARSSFVVPHHIELNCDKSMGNMCNGCPMADTMHEEITVSRNDPDVLKMIGVSDDDVTKVIKNKVGIPPRCKAVEIDADHQSVEILYARPSVEHSSGVNGNTLNSADTVLRLTSVGRHDTPSNCTVQVTGSVQNNPKSQEAEFQVWDLAKVKSMDDDFTFDDETHRRLKMFRPKRGQDPLDRLDEIALWLSHNVTHIYGRNNLHIGMDLVFHSILKFEFDGQPLDRGWLEMVVVGDTRTGKSLVANNLINLYRAGEIVDCERASMPGVVGGVQQIRNEWMVTWGAIPVNDRRLVVLDEVSGLTTDEIGQMSGLRASGIASIEKIVSEKTFARTRKIWLGNPREDVSMDSYSFGVFAIKPLIGRNEDVARFDFAMSLMAEDVPIDVIHNREKFHDNESFNKDDFATLVKWAWTRSENDIIWSDEATAAVLKEAGRLGREYDREPPLILPQDIRIKLARLAVAIASRLYSTRDGRKLLIRTTHVRAAAEFIRRLYSNERFGYGLLSTRARIEAEKAKSFTEDTIKILHRHTGLADFMITRPDGKFFARDLEEVLGLPREAVNAIINGLMNNSMVSKERGFVKIQPELQRILRGLV